MDGEKSEHKINPLREHMLKFPEESSVTKESKRHKNVILSENTEEIVQDGYVVIQTKPLSGRVDTKIPVNEAQGGDRANVKLLTEEPQEGKMDIMKKLRTLPTKTSDGTEKNLHSDSDNKEKNESAVTRPSVSLAENTNSGITSTKCHEQQVAEQTEVWKKMRKLFKVD